VRAYKWSIVFVSSEFPSGRPPPQGAERKQPRALETMVHAVTHPRIYYNIFPTPRVSSTFKCVLCKYTGKRVRPYMPRGPCFSEDAIDLIRSRIIIIIIIVIVRSCFFPRPRWHPFDFWITNVPRGSQHALLIDAPLVISTAAENVRSARSGRFDRIILLFILFFLPLVRTIERT